MVHATSTAHAGSPATVESAPRTSHPISVAALGWSLSLSFAISFVLCVLGYLFVSGLPVAHGALSIILPGFQFQSWPRFFLGLGESLVWGWYIALLFGSLYNFFAARVR